MKVKISYVPFIVILILLSTYFFVKLLDYAIENYALTRINTNSGPTKITNRHFVQPREDVFHPKYFKIFLDNIVKHKSGILAQKSFYAILIVLYLALNIAVFFMLFPPIKKGYKKVIVHPPFVIPAKVGIQ